MVEAIEEAIFPAVSLIFLLLGIVLLISILFSSFNPYDQIAFANAERLKAVIDDVCFKGTGSSVKLNSFELRQNTPSSTWLFTILPRWLIKVNGDPNYVLYYETFPPGEAIGWEAYHDFQNRLLAPLDNFDGKNSRDVENHVQNILNEYRSTGLVDAIILNNVMLSEDFRSDYIVKGTGAKCRSQGDFCIGGPVQQAQTEKEKFFGYGKWDNNFFRFSNYLGLSNLERTLIKYQTCGENSLCLKTRSGVYRFQLEHCGNIKGIQLVYDARGKVEDEFKALGFAAATVALVKLTGFTSGTLTLFTVGGITYTVEKAIEHFLVLFLAFKISDFNIVSPCELRDVEVNLGSCEEENKIGGLIEVDLKYSLCTEAVKHDLYQYDKEAGVKKIGEHYTCVEKIGEDVNIPNKISFGPSDECVKIKVDDRPKGYCWTPDPFKKFDDENFFGELVSSVTTQPIARVFGLTPIRESTDYFAQGDAKAFVLKPTGLALVKGEDFFEKLQKSWWWGWP